MEQASKIPVTEQGEPAPAVFNEHEEELTAQALDEIHEAERLSGFGRFATRLQSIFQGAPSTRTSKERAHLRLAPVMMSAGVLLLLATGLLFLLSKPESAVPGHFRQPTGLTGTNNPSRAAGSADETPRVTENQLVGSDGRNGMQQQKAGLQNGVPSRDVAAMQRLGMGQGPTSNQNSLAPQTVNDELQTPATVFTTGSPVTPTTAPLGVSAQSVQLQIQVPAGTEIAAHTTTAISSGLESPVVAVVDRNVELKDSVVIPQGSRVIGYTAGAVKDRVNIRFTSVLLPNNREMAISGLALMKDGSAGLVGKVQGGAHPILSTAARIGTGAAVVATEFAGQGSLNQPFSQADYLRNQMSAEVATEGNRLSNRFQQQLTVPIVEVPTNQSLRIFLMNALDVGRSRNQNSPQTSVVASASGATAQSSPSEQSLVAAQTAYIQALEAQLADMRTALNRKQPNGQQ